MVVWKISHNLPPNTLWLASRRDFAFFTFYFFLFRKERSCSACECLLSWLASRGIPLPNHQKVNTSAIPDKEMNSTSSRSFRYFIMVTNCVTSIEYQLCAPNANTVEVCDQYLKFLFNIYTSTWPAFIIYFLDIKETLFGAQMSAQKSQFLGSAHQSISKYQVT